MLHAHWEFILAETNMNALQCELDQMADEWRFIADIDVSDIDIAVFCPLL